MRAWFWSADTGGSAMYRMLLPSSALGWLGHTVGVGPSLPQAYRELADVVVGARVALPGPTKQWRELAERGCRLVLDLDDDYWHIDADNPGAAREWSPALLRGLDANLARSDVVTVVGEALAEEVREHTDTPVVVIPNALAAQNLQHVRDYRPDVLRVGWAGSRSTLNELHLAARALRRIADYRAPDGTSVEVNLVGVGPHEAVAHGISHPSRIRTHGWVAPEDYLSAAWGFDVWVAPYRPTRFNQAKFATKALEAGHLGIPLIASDIRPYREWISHGVTGFLVRHDHEWGHYLRLLADDPDLREAMGFAARAQACTSIMQTVNQQWEQVMTKPELAMGSA